MADKSELLLKIHQAKKQYLRHVGVLLAQALNAPGADAGMRNAGCIEWREPIHLAERIVEHRLRNGGTMQDAAQAVLPD